MGFFPTEMAMFLPRGATTSRLVTTYARDILLGGSSAASSSGDPDALQATGSS